MCRIMLTWLPLARDTLAGPMTLRSLPNLLVDLLTTWVQFVVTVVSLVGAKPLLLITW